MPVRNSIAKIEIYLSHPNQRSLDIRTIEVVVMGCSMVVSVLIPSGPPKELAVFSVLSIGSMSLSSLADER